MLKRLLVILLLISFKAFAQTPNIGFEDGTFTNWDCYIGKIDSISGQIELTHSNPVTDRHTMYGKTAKGIRDPYGNFPVLCPNGSKHSVRLGNYEAGAQAERLSYTLVVPNRKSYSVVFNYAVVLEDPGHPVQEQPKFTAQIYDVTDDLYIKCPYFDFAASAQLPGFKLSTTRGYKGDAIYYKDWSTATINLSSYVGKEIQIQFTTNDCARVVHFGYAYLDVLESDGNSITGNSYCEGQRNATLYAPNGFSSYEWYTSDFKTMVGTGQSITLSPPPPDNTEYALKIYPYPGLGCVDTLYTTVKKIDEGFRMKVTDTINSCPGYLVDLTLPEVTAGTSPNTSFSYFTDSLGTSYLYNPDRVDSSGTYYIQGINAEGCMNILPVRVNISAPDITVIDPRPVDFPTRVDLTKTFVHKPGITYSYFKDAAGADEINNYAALKYGGTYYIKATSGQGCSKLAKVNVVIHPPPPYTIVAPNTFTPNNDGINDRFSIAFDGIATLKTVKIYDRYGRLVYKSTARTTYWDGTNNGRNMPVGVYYWVLDGYDDYNQVEISKAGSITLIR
jgi:gliding motility-associated-like protein